LKIHILIGLEEFTGLPTESGETSFWINPFHVLINIFKSCLWNPFTKKYFQTSYFDTNSNTEINLFNLFCNMIETIQNYDRNYLDDFITFHFYGLFSEMITNKMLQREWEWTGEEPSFIGTYSEYTAEECFSRVSSYITKKEFDEMMTGVTCFNQYQVDFIHAISLVNHYVGNITPFSLKYYMYNGTDEQLATAKTHAEYRRLTGNNSGEDYILNTAKTFTNLTLQILYARENIKEAIQQYSYIGTKKIITDVMRSYFLKNFTKKSEWRFYSDENIQDDQIYISGLNDLNSDQFFDLSLIEYYDNTAYFNIQSELPSCIVDYVAKGKQDVEYFDIASADMTSAWVIDETVSAKIPGCSGLTSMEINGKTQWGVISSFTDDWGIGIPSSVHELEMNKYITGLVIDGEEFNVEYLKDTALWIPSGTEISSFIVPGSLITKTKQEDVYEPVYGLCSQFVYDFNPKFWNREWSYEVEHSDMVKNEIVYYENFFDKLKSAPNFDKKLEIYKSEIYPLLTQTWETFATSGFLSHPTLSGLQALYSGQVPGEKITQNHANKTFTTIATLPNIGNLTEVSPVLNEKTLYLSKPFSENIAYYILLLTKEILNMQDYNTKTGYGVPQTGWKRTFIEYKGYNSWYENSANTTISLPDASPLIDADGPWVYFVLQQFIKLYLENSVNKKIIPITTIKNFVDKYYITVTNESVKLNIVKQLWQYQTDIIEKQNYNVHDFQQDNNGNQFTLFKHYQWNKYEDAGEIWVRLNNYPLSMPLMFPTELPNSISPIYQTDEFDILQVYEDIEYANMLKELVNNAIQFGVIENSIWVLGYSKYLLINDKIVKNDDSQLKLKVGCFKVESDPQSLKLKVDTASIKFFGTTDNYDAIDSLDEFVGVYFNKIIKAWECILCAKQKYIDNAIVEPLRNNQNRFNGDLPFIIWTYPLADNTIPTWDDITFTTKNAPAFNLVKTDVVQNIQKAKQRPSSEKFEIAETEKNDVQKIINKPVNLALTETLNVNGLITPGNNLIDNYGAENIFTGAWLDDYKSDGNTVRGIFVSGIFEVDDVAELTVFGKFSGVSGVLICKNTNEAVSKNNTQIENLNSFLNNQTVNICGTILEDESFKYNPFIIDYETPWKINSDYETVSIGYEAYVEDVHPAFMYGKICGDAKDYFIGKIIWRLPIEKTKIQDGLWYINIKSCEYKFGTEQVTLQSLDDNIGLYILHNKFPKCSIEDNTLIVETLATTLGGKKSYVSITNDEGTDLLPNNVKNILKSCLVYDENSRC
jgi:hypothetical protein